MMHRDAKQLGFLSLWIISALLVAGTNSHWMTDTARVVRPATECVLSPSDVWQVPLACLSIAERITTWPYPLYVIAAATLIASACRSVRVVAPISLLAAVGLSLVIRPPDLFCACALYSVARLTTSTRLTDRPVAQGMLVDLCGLLSVLCVLDFGLVLLACGWSLVMIIHESKRRRVLTWLTCTPLVVAVIGIGLSVLLLPGFTAAMLRPISWLWVTSTRQVLPSLSVPATMPEYWISVGLLVVTALACWSALLRPDGDRKSALPLVMYSMMGLGCLRYLFLGWFAIVSLVRGQAVATVIPRRLTRILTLVLLAAALVRLVWRTDPVFLLTGVTAPRLLTPTDWNTRGGVLLLNLDHTEHWQDGDIASRFPLIIDDRWDAFGELYPTYAAVCRDIREVRVNSYLRTDGEWGGYRLWMNKWSPALLVVDSTDIDAIRGLTVSPDWRVMGIDGERTIFGATDLPRNVPQMSTALNCLMALEWPPLQSEVSLAGTIVANTDEDASRVAGVLCAMRLPYAALRFLHEDDSREKQRLQAWCFLELAHRIHLHSGYASLLDQYRAVVKVQELERESLWSTAERHRIARSLNGLGLPAIAREFDPKFADAESNVTPPAAEAQALTAAEDVLAMTDTERELRNALMAGRRDECQRLLAGIDDSLEEYYAVLIDSPDQTAETLCVQLHAAIDAAKGMSAEIRSEALFYLGCAAIEAGDTPLAVSALQRSDQLAPKLPWREIRTMYLRQSAL